MSVIMMSVIMMSVIMMSVIMMSVIMMSVIWVSLCRGVIKLNVIILTVAALRRRGGGQILLHLLLQAIFDVGTRWGAESFFVINHPGALRSPFTSQNTVIKAVFNFFVPT
jgi:hypothetical protein